MPLVRRLHLVRPAPPAPPPASDDVAQPRALLVDRITRGIVLLSTRRLTILANLVETLVRSEHPLHASVIVLARDACNEAEAALQHARDVRERLRTQQAAEEALRGRRDHASTA